VAAAGHWPSTTYGVVVTGGGILGASPEQMRAAGRARGNVVAPDTDNEAFHIVRKSRHVLAYTPDAAGTVRSRCVVDAAAVPPQVSRPESLGAGRSTLID
jgi:hypothetical protein